MQTLTRRQKQVFDLIRDHFAEESYRPTLEELRKRLRLSSVSTVHQHVEALVNLGLLRRNPDNDRGVELASNGTDLQKEISLIGTITAGAPIEPVETPETISVAPELTEKTGKHFALRVRGDSMQDADIADGDIAVIRSQSTANNGDIVVALLDNGSATLKRFFRKNSGYVLQPANQAYRPSFVREVTIQGKLTGVLRSGQTRPTPLQFPLLNFPTTPSRLQISSRRYLGNKAKLLGFIGDIVAEKCPDYKSFCDVFAGTGVVGYHFNRPQVRILSNDLLMSNFISLQAWLGTRSLNQDRIRNFINYLNEIRPRSENYVSKSFGAAYFTMENARKIGAVREEVEKLSVSEDEKNILLTSLIYAVDKVANTVGHYETFRKRLDTTAPLTLLMPDISTLSNSGNHIYRRDANDLVRDIEVDVLYLDPPYNSRQYGDSYHLLENIVAWKKPKVFGVGRKMAERDNLKSKYCLKEAPSAFQDLIDNCRAKHILLSYNNTAEKMNSRSNARISDEFITKILTRRGRVEVFEREYRGFTTGKSKDLGNSERIFYCKVER